MVEHLRKMLARIRDLNAVGNVLTEEQQIFFANSIILAKLKKDKFFSS